MTSDIKVKVRMGEITGGEARELYASNPIILLPMGSHEDQGPHAPMGDYLLAEKIAEMAALRAGERGVRTVVAPVVPFGGVDYFGPMPGGIALSQTLLAQLIGEVLECLHGRGLTRLIVINGHGGNVGPINEAARNCYRRTKRVIPSIYLWRIAAALLPDVVGVEKARLSLGHGADPLTSIGLHLFPELMRADLVPEATPLRSDPLLDLPFTDLGSLSFEGHEVSVPHEYDEIFHQGVGKGDPRCASAATGAELTERLTEVCARFAVHFASRVARWACD
ncbi:MAG: creatininase family protein [Burkholderiaceae bacterium]|nr:creatininase family protein [Burkholderiaceae bacterium]